MNHFILLMLASILAGFALVKVPVAGTFLASLSPFIVTLGALAVVVFSLILIFKGIMALINK
ncbi:hypothetical protein GN156_15960 [bacterium LRH843]|nr:hypothetical protein [bacterium LRH843]